MAGGLKDLLYNVKLTLTFAQEVIDIWNVSLYRHASTDHSCSTPS